MIYDSHIWSRARRHESVTAQSSDHFPIKHCHFWLDWLKIFAMKIRIYWSDQIWLTNVSKLYKKFIWLLLSAWTLNWFTFYASGIWMLKANSIEFLASKMPFSRIERNFTNPILPFHGQMHTRIIKTATKWMHWFLPFNQMYKSNRFRESGESGRSFRKWTVPR